MRMLQQRERERGRRRRTGIRSNLFANSAECLCMRVSESESLNGMCMNRERLNRLNRVVLLTGVTGFPIKQIKQKATSVKTEIY